MQHFSTSSYRTMPWANGLGQTIEMIRKNDSDGNLLWRLSMAAVVDDGAFSLFPKIERNLTVISGTGFDLVGDGITLRAAPLVPVAFAGDTPIAAQNVTDVCHDFNVMAHRSLPQPEVRIHDQAADLLPSANGFMAILALSPATLSSGTLGTHELLLCEESVSLATGQVICVRFGHRLEHG